MEEFISPVKEFIIPVKEFIIPPVEINTRERSLDSFEYHKLRYSIASQYCKNQIVLDVGCGLGYGTSLLSEKAKQRKLIEKI